MSQALQERDLIRLLREPKPKNGSGGRMRRVRRVRWRFRPRVALLQRFLLAAGAWSVAALTAAGALSLQSGPVAIGAGWALAAGSSLWVLGLSERRWWVRWPTALLLPALAAGWVVAVAQKVAPVGTGASAGLTALGLGALGLRLAGFAWDYKVLAFAPALALLALPLEMGWARPGAGQYTLLANLLLWGALALTVPLEQATSWRPRVLSLGASAGAGEPATVGVLGTLGDLHLKERFTHYTLDALDHWVRAFRPDVLCVSVHPEDLLAYRQDPAHSALPPEYRECLFPLAEEEAIPVVPVDGAGEDLRLLERAAEADPRLAGRDRAERERMLALWRRSELGPLCCNDQDAQEAARACHEARWRSAPELEQVLWHQRNEDLAAGVLDVLRENPGRRVLVVVGAEHVYWVREALGKADGLNLLPPV